MILDDRPREARSSAPRCVTVWGRRRADPQPSAPPIEGGGGRLGLRALDYRIPAAANRWPYMLGGITAALIALLGLTGLYLEQFYQPNPVGARDSVLYIITRAPLGD